MNKLIEKIKALNAYQPKKGNWLDTAETCYLLFSTGAVIGWIYEFFFYLIVDNIVANSGFFFGPYLPIYGFGALLIVLLTKRFKKHPVAVFFLTIPITGILEYISGYWMYALWQQRWWDYTGKLLNIDGFVCLRSVLTFAIGAIALLYFVEPFILWFCDKVSRRSRHILCGGILFLFLCDVIMTLLIRVPQL